MAKKRRSVTEGTISSFQFLARFPTEKAARMHIERLRWGDSPICVHCGSARISYVKNERPQPYRCKDCRKFFSVRTGTIFQGANLALRTCLYAMYLFSISKKNVSSCQLARELGITQKSAWYLVQRIREAYTGETDGMLDGVVEVDEAYMGGKEKNKHQNKRLNAGRGSVGKQAIIGAKSRDGYVVAVPAKIITANSAQGFIHRKVSRGATVYTDKSRVYDGLNINGHHETVNHSAGEYVRGQAHTNGIESFWALLKRGYHGTFHHFSAKHCHRYVSEFATRHNRAGWTTEVQIDQLFRQTFNKTFSYKELIA